MLRVQRRGWLTAVVLAGTIAAAGGGLAAASGAPSAGKAAQQPRRRDPRRRRGSLAAGGGAGRLPGQPAQGPGRGERERQGQPDRPRAGTGVPLCQPCGRTAAGAGEQAARAVRQRGDVRAERGGRRRRRSRDRRRSRSRTSNPDDESGQPTPTDPEGPTSTEDGPFPVAGTNLQLTVDWTTGAHSGGRDAVDGRGPGGGVAGAGAEEHRRARPHPAGDGLARSLKTSRSCGARTEPCAAKARSPMPGEARSPGGGLASRRSTTSRSSRRCTATGRAGCAGISSQG